MIEQFRVRYLFYFTRSMLILEYTDRNNKNNMSGFSTFELSI